MKFINVEKYKDKIGIYRIKNLINGKLYIGQTSDRFIERYWNHCWKLNNKTHDNNYLQNSWNKYGEENFEFSVIHVLKENEDIDQLEFDYIHMYKDYDTYNIQYGGQNRTALGTHLSDEARKFK